jgi:hypothetical protein
MGNSRNRFPARRRFLKQSAALSAGAAALATPAIVLSQGRKAPAGGTPVEAASGNAPTEPQAGTMGIEQRNEADPKGPRKP